MVLPIVQLAVGQQVSRIVQLEEIRTSSVWFGAHIEPS